MKKILFIFGTRPEAIKLFPLIKKMRSKPRQFKTIICVTGQHRTMLDQVMNLFDISSDYDVAIMEKDQSLGRLSEKLFGSIGIILDKEKPDCIIVQGDTTSAFITSLIAFYHKIPIAHIEAGLRSFDKYQPFPEEINRSLISRVADFHFAPTQKSKKNLRKEGINASSIFVTGNTIIDALQLIKKKLDFNKLPLTIDPKKKLILVTAHRRESFGKPIANICRALQLLAHRNEDIEIVYPVHLNPNVQKVVYPMLKNRTRIRLLKPLDYFQILTLISKSYLIITDSGGIQEEAPSFHKPVLVLRNVTERPEGVERGIAKIVGTDTTTIVKNTEYLLKNPNAYKKMVNKKNPYGDGHAAERIVKIIAQAL